MKLLPLKVIKLIFFIIAGIKIAVIFSIKASPNFSMGTDSDYYHNYAIGHIDHAVNSWPIFLRLLNDYGLYDRGTTSVILSTISLFFLPFLISSLLNNRFRKKNKLYLKTYWHLATLIVMYPTITLYATDVYRDTAMILLFVISLIFVQRHIILDKKFSIYLVFSLLIFYLLFLLRPYLGASLIFCLVLYKLRLSKKNIITLAILYFIMLIILKEFNLIDPLLEYRNEDTFGGGASSLKIFNLKQANSLEFIILYCYSALMQLFGFFIISFKALAIFLSESLFFIFASIYVYKNRKYLSSFELFLILFSIIYASIWIIANDNLGTAARLRTYNYISIYIVTSMIFLKKMGAHYIKTPKDI